MKFGWGSFINIIIMSEFMTNINALRGISADQLIDQFVTTSSLAWLSAASIEQETVFQDKVDEAYMLQQSLITAINKQPSETLNDVCRRLGLWVLSNYPDETQEVESEWDRLIINAYYDIAGFLGTNTFRRAPV